MRNVIDCFEVTKDGVLRPGLIIGTDFGGHAPCQKPFHVYCHFDGKTLREVPNPFVNVPDEIGVCRRVLAGT